MTRRDGNKTALYVRLMNYKCANPGCMHGFDVNGHHITPLQDGGDDKYWNIVCLCKKCHKSAHTSTFTSRDDLFVWKCIQEMETIGFCLDEYDSMSVNLMRKAGIRIRGKELPREE
jgi:predicted restriction endonuclease